MGGAAPVAATAKRPPFLPARTSRSPRRESCNAREGRLSRRSDRLPRHRSGDGPRDPRKARQSAPAGRPPLPKFAGLGSAGLAFTLSGVPAPAVTATSASSAAGCADVANLGTACADAVASCFRDSAGIRALDCRVPRRSQTWRSSRPAPATTRRSRRRRRSRRSHVEATIAFLAKRAPHRCQRCSTHWSVTRPGVRRASGRPKQPRR